MKQVYDGPLAYPSNWNGMATCRVRVYQEGTDFTVIATELPENHGTSITNAAERVVTVVCLRFNIDPRNLTWIEHYPDRNTPHSRESIFDEHYSRVTFEILRTPRPLWYAPNGTREPFSVIVAHPQWEHMPVDDPLITSLLTV
jgi:hypothetical protein